MRMATLRPRERWFSRWARSGFAGAAMALAGFSGGALGRDAPGFCPDLAAGFALSEAMSSPIATPANAEDWPWFAALRHNDARTGLTYFCGGAVIAPEWVVTAAHCVSLAARSAENDEVVWRIGVNDPLEVAIGVSDLREDAAAERLRGVADVIIFDGYRANLNALGVLGVPSGDIALIRLDEPWDGPTLRVSRAAASDPGEDARAFIVGFGGERAITGDASPLSRFPLASADPVGASDFVRAGSPVLRQSMTPLADQLSCRAAYPDLSPEQNVCAGYVQGEEEACQADSGGPLVALDMAGCPYLIGVHSYGRGCARSDAPGVYARASYFADWIDAVISGEMSNRRTDPEAGPAFDYPAPEPEPRARAVNELTEALLADLSPAVNRADPEVSRAVAASRSVAPNAEPVETVLAVGERLSFSVASEVAGRLVLIDVGADGDVVQVYPNGCFTQSVRLDGGGAAVPGVFEAQPPEGRRRLVAVVAPDDFPLEDTVGADARVGSCAAFGEEAAPVAYMLNILREVRGVLLGAARGGIYEDQAFAAVPLTAFDVWAAGWTGYRIVEP